MISEEEIKSQFDSAVEQLKGKLSSLPESISILVNILISSFYALFEFATNKIQELTDELKLKNQENLKLHELIKSLKTLLKSKDVDIDAMKRLLFQGGREQKEQSAPQEKTEKPQSKTAKTEKDRTIPENWNVAMLNRQVFMMRMETF